MKLTYWYAECLTDSDCYSVRERTKKAAKAQVAELTGSGQGWSTEYGAVKKVTVEYDDGFELMWRCVSEGRFHWEV